MQTQTEYAYHWLRHNGDLYAVESQRLSTLRYGRIVRAVGPLSSNTSLQAFAHEVVANAEPAAAHALGAKLDTEVS